MNMCWQIVLKLNRTGNNIFLLYHSFCFHRKVFTWFACVSCNLSLILVEAGRGNKKIRHPKPYCLAFIIVSVCIYKSIFPLIFFLLDFLIMCLKMKLTFCITELMNSQINTQCNKWATFPFVTWIFITSTSVCNAKEMGHFA